MINTTDKAASGLKQQKQGPALLHPKLRTCTPKAQGVCCSRGAPSSAATGGREPAPREPWREPRGPIWGCRGLRLHMLVCGTGPACIIGGFIFFLFGRVALFHAHCLGRPARWDSINTTGKQALARAKPRRGGPARPKTCNAAPAPRLAAQGSGAPSGPASLQRARGPPGGRSPAAAAHWECSVKMAAVCVRARVYV